MADYSHQRSGKGRPTGAFMGFPAISARAPCRASLAPCLHTTASPPPSAIRLSSACGHASAATGCEILGKAEFMNPGGSVKDRTALGLLNDAERGPYPSGRRAWLKARRETLASGWACSGQPGLPHPRGHAGYPEPGKNRRLARDRRPRAAGAGRALQRTPPLRAGPPEAGRGMNAADPGSAWFANQFDNTANRDWHEADDGSGNLGANGRPNRWLHLRRWHGGTLAGVGRALKARRPGVRIALADPAGSAFAAFVKTGNSSAKATRSARASAAAAITANFEGAPVDVAWSIPDTESVPLAP